MDELALVVELAILTEDRAPEEQRALLRTALKVDVTRARWTITNPDPVEPHLTLRVAASYEPGDGRKIRVPAEVDRRFSRCVMSYRRGLAEHLQQQAAIRDRARAGAGEAIHGEASA